MYSLLSWLWYTLTRPGQRGKWGNILAFIKRLLASVLPLCLFSTLGSSSRGTSQRRGHPCSSSGREHNPSFPLALCEVGSSRRKKNKGGKAILGSSWDRQALYCSWPYKMWERDRAGAPLFLQKPQVSVGFGVRTQAWSPPRICV